MFKSLTIVFILTISACKSEVKKPNLISNPPSVEISTVIEDSISIRALDFENKQYWFAGSKAKYGYINNLTNEVITFQIDSINDLEFRSIAATPNYTYILTAGNPALVYKISQDNNKIQLVYTEEGESVFYDSMKFWNDTEGIALGDPQNGCFSLIKTIDGGKNWQKTNCEAMPKALSGEAAFAASNSNLKIYKNHIWFVTGGKHSRVFHSKNKGQSWKVYTTPVISGKQMTGIYAIDFYDENLGVIIGGDWNNKNSKNKNIAITTDGGKTWQLLSNETGPGYCSDIVFIPETQGQELLAVGSLGIWWSENQGKNWKKLSNEGFYTVEMVNKSDGFLAGHHKISRLKLKR
ncbi:WD40/YVTN/BNR-like repeat-containing protein [Flavobacteriaceae bacterium 14752]|uniref:WD40/YVTN/BNR-like repeat-containing protein n=1 Tax=Mesohalobacter salilacus TaxID=2491711 RepID=UPI000F63DA91|nr:exo-alpha-sialidase [Flavobacteriaceae bacterium 14752]